MTSQFKVWTLGFYFANNFESNWVYTYKVSTFCVDGAAYGTLAQEVEAMQDKRQTEDIAVEAIVEAIRNDIIGGQLAPGSDINSVELATRFGTSRTPVREALLILDRFGLVTLAARKRPRVAEVSVQSIRDLFALRIALHRYISDAIVEKASDAELQQMRGRAQALVDAHPGKPLVQRLAMIEDYLDAEYLLCGNRLVIEMLDSLKWRIGWFRRIAMISDEQIHAISIDRLRVADAYLDRDAPLAAALNSSMLRRGLDFSETNYLASALKAQAGAASRSGS